MIKKNIYFFLIFAGYLSFTINSMEHLLIRNPYILIISYLLLFYLFYKERKSNSSLIINLIPFSSGILSFLMKFFYIDKFDYAERLNNLILLSLLFSLIVLIIKYKLYEKILSKFNVYSIKKRVIVIFIITELIFIVSSFILVKKGVVLVGDEPHYLAISHSIAKDFDVNVFNQYARDEYRDFIDYRIRSHAKEGKGFKKWYSIHLPGVSFTIAPFLLFKIPFPVLYFLLRSFMGLFGAGLAVLIYLFSIKLIKKENLSLFITIVFTFTAPVFFMSIHIFAEIQALFLMLLSMYLLFFNDIEKTQWLRLLLSGLFISLTVFWGVKYSLFIAFYLAGCTIYFFKNKKIINIIYISIFPILSIIIFCIFLYYAYGTISPTAVYTGLLSEIQKAEIIKNTKMIPFSLRIETLLDYFFDQKDGLILYNPFYLFFFPGLLIAIKKFRKYYPFLLISLSGFVYLLYHGYSTIRAGYCPQARYLTPLVWMFLLFAVIYYIESKNKLLKKVFLFIPLYSFSIVFYQLFNPFTLYQQTTHDSPARGGLLFQKLSTIFFNIPDYLPSFAKTEGNFKYIPNIVLFVSFILLLIFALKKFEFKSTRILHTSIFAILFLLVSLFPKIPLYNPIKVDDPKNRNIIPFYFYSNRNPSGRTYEEGFSSIKGNGEFKFYLSIPKIFLIKHRQKLLKNISASISFKNFKRPFEVEIYNYDLRILNEKVMEGSNINFNIKKINIKMIDSKALIVFTLIVKENNNKSMDFRLKLFSLNDRLM